MGLITKPPAELVIRRPDGTEKRFVRKKKKADEGGFNASDIEQHDEDYRAIMNTPPYTISFDNLLKDTRSQNPARFVKLTYERMISDAIPLSTTTYNLLMKHVVSFTDGLIFELYEKLKEEGTKEYCSVRPDLESFRLLFHACERGALYNRAFLFYQQMREVFHLVPDTSAYNTLLGFCAAVQDVAQATYFIDEMKENDVPLDVNTYNCFISVMVSSAPYNEVRHVFYDMCERGMQPTRRTFHMMLKAAHIHGDYDGAFQLLEEMHKRGIVSNITTYNFLFMICEQRLDYILARGNYAHIMRTLGQRRHGLKALAELTLALLSEMEAVLVVPNTFSFNRVLSILLECEDMRLFSVFDKVLAGYDKFYKLPVLPKKEGHPPQRNGAVAHKGNDTNDGLAKDARPASEILEEAMRKENPQEEGSMEALQVLPNLVTYKILFKAHLRFDLLDKSKSLYRDFLRYQLQPDREMLMLLWKICARLPDRSWAETLLETAVKLRHFINAEFLNEYLAVLVVTDSEAFDIMVDSMRKKVNVYGAQANTQTNNLILESHLRRGSFAQGLAFFAEEMGHHYSPLQPNDATYCLVIRLYAAMRDLDGATNFMEDALYRNTKFGISVFEELLQLYQRNSDSRIEKCFNCLRRALTNSHSSSETVDYLLPDISVKCYASVMEYYSTHGKPNTTIELFRELKASQRLAPDGDIFCILLRMYRDQKNAKGMIGCFEDARLHGIQFDITMYNLALETLVDTKDSFVFNVLSDMLENNIAPEDSTIALFLTSPSKRKLLNDAMENNLFYICHTDAYAML